MKSAVQGCGSSPGASLLPAPEFPSHPAVRSWLLPAQQASSFPGATPAGWGFLGWEFWGCYSPSSSGLWRVGLHVETLCRGRTYGE